MENMETDIMENIDKPNTNNEDLKPIHILVVDAVAPRATPDPFHRCLHKQGQKVSVCGVVTAVDISSRCTVHTVDDATGSIPCIVWKPDVSPIEGNTKEKATDDKDYEKEYPLGTLLHITGSLRKWRGNSALFTSFDQIKMQRDPGIEPRYWLEAITDYAQWAKETDDKRYTKSPVSTHTAQF